MILTKEQKRLKLNAYLRKCYKENPEKYKKRVKEWRKNNPYKVIEIGIKYRETHKEEIKKKDIRYKKENPERYRKMWKKAFLKHKKKKEQKLLARIKYNEEQWEKERK